MIGYSRHAGLALLTALSLSGAESAYAQGVLELTAARLQLAQQVAASKWIHQLAIDDPAREAVLLKEMRDQALVVGASGDWIEAFFRDQIDASKAVQRGWFALWSAGSQPVPDKAPDLHSLIRPQIDALDQQLLATLVLKGGVSSHSDCAEQLADAVQGFSPNPPVSRDILSRALAHACLPESPD